MAVPHPKQGEAMAHIRECLIAHGPELGVAVARVKYGDVPQPTWSRWNRAAKLSYEAEHAAASTPQSGMTLGDASSPSVSTLDFFEGQLSESLRDIEMLRQQALMRDVSGNLKLKNSMLMTQAIRLRNQMLDLYTRRQEAALGAERVSQFQELVVGAIDSALSNLNDPAEKAVARRVSIALRNAKKQWEATLHIVDPRKAAAAIEAGYQQSVGARVQ